MVIFLSHPVSGCQIWHAVWNGMLMWSAPIVYSASTLEQSWRFIYSLNPIVGIIEGYRACFLGTPIPWEFIGPGMLLTLIIFFTGARYFKRMEYMIVDVI